MACVVDGLKLEGLVGDLVVDVARVVVVVVHRVVERVVAGRARKKPFAAVVAPFAVLVVGDVVVLGGLREQLVEVVVVDVAEGHGLVGDARRSGEPEHLVEVEVEPVDGRVELRLGEAVVWSLLEELLEFVVVNVAERHVRESLGLVCRVNGQVELGQQGRQLRVKFVAFAKFHVYARGKRSQVSIPLKNFNFKDFKKIFGKM